MSNTGTSSSTAFNPEAVQRMANTSVYYENISQEFIYTTADKLKLCLIDYKSVLRARTEWITPLGILFSIVATLVVSDFKDFLNIPATVWATAFFIFGIIITVWLLISVIKAIRHRKKGNIDKFIHLIKIGDKEN